jgi:hypothetical protein
MVGNRAAGDASDDDDGEDSSDGEMNGQEWREDGGDDEVALLPFRPALLAMTPCASSSKMSPSSSSESAKSVSFGGQEACSRRCQRRRRR